MASATIYAKIVPVDELIPRVVAAQDEDNDVQKLTPWVYRHADIATSNCEYSWPQNDYRFKYLFIELPQYCEQVEFWEEEEEEDRGREVGETGIGITSALREAETITLPRKNWNVSKNQRFGQFIHWQGSILQNLLRDVYVDLDKNMPPGLRIHFPAAKPKLKYVVGGKLFAARHQGSVTVGPLGSGVPIISFTGWFEGQTWKEFLGETVSVMLGQLAQNLKACNSNRGPGLCDQEVFVVGFHGHRLHVARGFFKRHVIPRVQSKGCSESEKFELGFTRGYNLCLRQDWFEATRVLTRLFRYLLSGRAKVGGMQAALVSMGAAK